MTIKDTQKKRNPWKKASAVTNQKKLKNKNNKELSSKKKNNKRSKSNSKVLNDLNYNFNY